MSVVVCFRVALVCFVNKSMVNLIFMEPQEWTNQVPTWKVDLVACMSAIKSSVAFSTSDPWQRTLQQSLLLISFFHTLIHFPPQCWLTVSDLFSLFCLCVCREISVEKLNLEGTSPPKAEIRRDVVDAPAPLVSEWERERDGWMPKKRGSRGKDGHLKTIMLLFCSLPTWGFWLVNSAPVIGHCTVCCSEI